MRNVFRRLRFRKTCRSVELNKQINIAFYLHYFFQFYLPFTKIHYGFFSSHKTDYEMTLSKKK